MSVLKLALDNFENTRQRRSDSIRGELKKQLVILLHMEKHFVGKKKHEMEKKKGLK